MESTEKNKELVFKYKFDSNYNPIYVNGVYGGFNFKGELNMNFFMERLALPYKEVYGIDNKGEAALKKSVPKNEETLTVIRFIESGIVLSYDSALMIKEWLDKHISLYEERTNEVDNNDKP